MVKDYSTAIIYKIWSNNTGRCYVGSTVQRLSARMGGHRRDYKSFKKTGKIICSSSFIFDDGDIKYERIAKNSCENLEQLRKAEGFYQKKYECVNIRREGRTAKEWYQDNKERISKRQKEYRQNNKDKIKKQKKEYRQKNKEKISKQDKEYYRDNKEQITKRHKKYCQKNKEKIKKRSKKYICVCCGGSYTTNNWCKHVKTKKHIKVQELQEEIQSLIPLYHQ